MPLIPIPAEQLPTRVEKMDDTAVYKGIIRECNLAEKLDSGGHKYLTLAAQVLDPIAWKDRVVSSNYIGLPGIFDKDTGEVKPLNEFEQKKEMERMGQPTGLGRLLASARIKGLFEKEDFLGREITFMIQNEEFPKGTDNWLPKFKLFLE